MTQTIDLFLKPYNESIVDGFKSYCSLGLQKMKTPISMCKDFTREPLPEKNVCEFLTKKAADRYIMGGGGGDDENKCSDTSGIIHFCHVKRVEKCPILFLLNTLNVSLYNSFAIISDVEHRYITRTQIEPFDYIQDCIYTIIRLFGEALVYFISDHKLVKCLNSDIDTFFTTGGFGSIVNILLHVMKCDHGKIKFHGCFYEHIFSAQTCRELYRYIGQNDFLALKNENVPLCYSNVRLNGIPHFYHIWSSVFLLAKLPNNKNNYFVKFMTMYVHKITGCSICIQSYPPKLKRGVELCQYIHKLNEFINKTGSDDEAVVGLKLPILFRIFCPASKLATDTIYPPSVYIYNALWIICMQEHLVSLGSEASIQIMAYLYMMLLIWSMRENSPVIIKTVAAWVIRNLIRLSKYERLYPLREIFSQSEIDTFLAYFKEQFYENKEEIFETVEKYVFSSHYIYYLLSIQNEDKKKPNENKDLVILEPRDKPVDDYLRASRVGFFYY